MSLLGRLEDLSLTDIVQIVFLSRRTGVLEIVNERGRHTVLFRQGLVVNASSPDSPDLVTFLRSENLIPDSAVATLKKMEESGIPYGTAAVELNILSAHDLATSIRNRILSVVAPLLQSREGEFNFILSESMSALDIEYEPDTVFKEGGFAPQKIIGAAEGEKIKPLRGLEESLKAGKALLRGSNVAEPQTSSLNLGLGSPGSVSKDAPTLIDVPAPPVAQSAPEDFPPANNVVPFAPREEGPRRITTEEELAGIASLSEPPVSRPAERSGQFKVAGGLFDIESPESAFRNVVLYERSPLIRVAAKRAFAKRSIKIFQFGSLEDVRKEITEQFRTNSFFITFLELAENDRGPDSAALRILQQVKRRNPRLPVVIIDSEADLRRRHEILRLGADLYLTKPAADRMQPGLAEEELGLFSDELVLFADRAFAQFEQMTGGRGDAAQKFYEEADKASVERSFNVLKKLINELSNPNDIGQVSATILRLAGEYLERAALFMVGDTQFIGLGGFGTSAPGGATIDSRVRTIRLSRTAPSILSDVAESKEPHRGKMRKTEANVELIERLGNVLPTEVVALPVMHGDRAIGILYGDNAEHRAPLDNTAGLEIFLSQAGYAFGNAVFASQRH